MVLHDLQGSFGELMYDLCELISNNMASSSNHLNTSRLAAMDIGCGYHSYTFDISRWQFKVCTYVYSSVCASFKCCGNYL